MDAFTDPKVKVIVGMFSAQTSKTTIIENAVGYFAQHDPCPIMVVEPTLEIAEAMSKDRFAPMIRDTPSLKERFSVSGSKSSGDTLLHKKFPGGSLTLAGANSYNSLASRPIRVAIGDEAAKWTSNEKGSPFRQLTARVKGFWNRKVAFFSTPTDSSPENEFWQLWDQSDKRLFFSPCECGESVVFTFDAEGESLPADVDVSRAVLRFVESLPIQAADGRKIRQASEAWFECLACGQKIDDVGRRRMVRAGEWQPTQEFRGIAGFWGWQALSPFDTAGAVSIANDWLSALGNPATLQSAKNETLGLPWHGIGEAPQWERLYERQEQYETGPHAIIPERALFITAGVDVQKDRIEIQVLAHARHGERWLVEYHVISGNPFQDALWAELAEFSERTYEHVSGARLGISRGAIDSGFAAHEVYNWARNRPNWMVVKGFADGDLVGKWKLQDINWRGKQVKSGIKLWPINVSELKRRLFFGDLVLDRPDDGTPTPRYFHVAGQGRDWFRQLTAERLVTKKLKGYLKQAWEKWHERNEALDTHNYAMVAQIAYSGKFTEDYWKARESQLIDIKAAQARPEATPQPVQQAQQPQRERGGWIERRRGWMDR